MRLLSFLYFHGQLAPPALSLPLAAINHSHLLDGIIDASVLLDDLLMMGMTLYGITSSYIVAHHLIDADIPLLLGAQIEQRTHGHHKFYVTLILHPFPVIFLRVFSDYPSTLYLLTHVDFCINMKELLQESEG